MSERDEFEVWWDRHGQFVRAGGGDYEKCFAYAAWNFRATPQQAVPALIWVGLTDKERDGFVDEIVMHGTGFVTPLYAIIEEIEGLLRAKNAAAPRQAAPEGWTLVPVEPTESMRLAPAKDRPGFSRNVAAEIYRSMLAAAPQPSQEPDRVPKRSAMYDRIMSGQYPNPDEATNPSTTFPKYQD